MNTHLTPEGRIETCNTIEPERTEILVKTDHPDLDMRIIIIVKRVGFQMDKLNSWGEPTPIVDLTIDTISVIRQSDKTSKGE